MEREESQSSAARDVARVAIFVRGRVQGVGFRWWTRARALELGLVGHARNLADGRVEVVAQGSPEALARLETLLREQPSTSRRPGHVEGLVVQQHVPRDGIAGFTER
ncbi:acylphosphatase [Intrasporangium oryzae NRRL B-24470]|uniref:acylphosphatase n=1 Tax=Intrasporangium oryzae NRRL B-24470 TaxID=1386089 RepID=W9G2D5_9MICO|nr:acylphosphatase [Intrasporangium oryzae]EWT00140.1 acylphosphatase [Intrasporangium oryzae NRRL B-24470]